MIQDYNFGIEIEMTGLTRKKAARVIAEHFGTVPEHVGGNYDKYIARDPLGRVWQVVSDSSIESCRKINGSLQYVDDRSYQVEMVSPICSYSDIETIQEIVRKLRGKGALANDSTGIHVHVDAMHFDANSLRNLTNIMRSKEDILYKALQVDIERENTYCKKVDEGFLQRLNEYKPKTREELKQLWYNGDDGSGYHYHHSRYKGLNLHAVFQKGTVEFRLFNGTTHAGKIKTYIQLSLAICNQALTQKRARFTRTQSANEKYTFRTWLLRLGLIGEEFKTARRHLLANLDGNIAWKDPEQAERQKERMQTLSVARLENVQVEQETGQAPRQEQNETTGYDYGYGGMEL